MAAFKIFEVAVATVFVLGAMEAAVIGTEFKQTFEPTDEEMAREIGQFLETVESLFDTTKNKTRFPGANGYCTCEGTHCRCCERFLWKEFCVVLDHHSHSDSLELSLKCGNTKIISHTFSVKDHPPFCFSTSYIPGAKACLHLDSLRIAEGKITACISISAKFWFYTKKFDLGCFKIVQNSEKIELTTVMKLVHETMAKHAELQPAVWIKDGEEPIVAFQDVVNLFVAASNVEQPRKDPDQK